MAICACGPAYQAPPDQEPPSPSSGLPVALKPGFPAGFKADLITTAGISVQTNGQYKTAAQRQAAAAAIDRYWNEVRECALGKVQSGDMTNTLIPQFPGRLAIEIANDWKVVEGPTTHHRMQAFPSRARPGAWSSARRSEDSIYIVVVPELIGLGEQMAGALSLWLAANTHTAGFDLAETCGGVACIRFAYANSPSQSWDECTD